MKIGKIIMCNSSTQTDVDLFERDSNFCGSNNFNHCKTDKITYQNSKVSKYFIFKNSEINNLSSDEIELKDEICQTFVLDLLKLEINDLFITSYEKFSKKFKKEIFSDINHTLYREYEKHIMFHSVLEENENIVIDDVFILYIEQLRKTLTSANQIKQHLRLLLLFREFLNIEFENMYNLNKRIEYTATQFNYELPNYVNKFLDLYLEVCDSTFEIGLDEGLLIISKLCSWLYKNNYTNLRLFKNQLDKS